MEHRSTGYVIYIQYIYNTKTLLIVPETYCYIWINRDSRNTYFTIFQRLFDIIKDTAREPVQFSYLTRTDGLRTITVDMCAKQAGGTYMYCICRAYTRTHDL